ncbi:hypothetical protein BdWA1_001051 [Babesia duncani]|uniref:Uncharacterized protein n=1 Tax=Babesia duncani TaxID=323732 RepID=A0AAD9PNE6_9APIC|nr:hypothetical protein BdWA1_001051 [Babesia duncani]
MYHLFKLHTFVKNRTLFLKCNKRYINQLGPLKPKLNKAKDDLVDYKHPKTDRYSFPENPDELLVNKTRLTFQEWVYQYFAAGFPILMLITFMCIPISLASLLYMKEYFQKSEGSDKIEKPEQQNDHIKQYEYDSSFVLPSLIKAADLSRLVYLKIPTIIFYFNTNQDLENSLAIRLTSVILGEIARLDGFVHLIV